VWRERERERGMYREVVNRLHVIPQRDGSRKRSTAVRHCTRERTLTSVCHHVTPAQNKRENEHIYTHTQTKAESE
jgi:hypothetical protein